MMLQVKILTTLKTAVSRNTRNLKLLHPSTTATIFLPISWTSPFTVASTTVPVQRSRETWAWPIDQRNQRNTNFFSDKRIIIIYKLPANLSVESLQITNYLQILESLQITKIPANRSASFSASPLSSNCCCLSSFMKGIKKEINE